MINQRLARDILAAFGHDMSVWDNISDHFTIEVYLYHANLEWRIGLFAVWTEPNERKLRFVIARRWGQSYRRIAYVDYETLLSLVGEEADLLTFGGYHG